MTTQVLICKENRWDQIEDTSGVTPPPGDRVLFLRKINGNGIHSNIMPSIMVASSSIHIKVIRDIVRPKYIHYKCKLANIFDIKKQNTVAPNLYVCKL